MIIVIMHAKIEASHWTIYNYPGKKDRFFVLMERIDELGKKNEVQATPYKNINQIFGDPLIMGGVLDRFVEGNLKLVTNILSNS